MAKDDRVGVDAGLDESEESGIDELVALYVGRLSDGELLDPDDIRLRHPDVADTLLSALETFVEAGPCDRR